MIDLCVSLIKVQPNQKKTPCIEAQSQKAEKRIEERETNIKRPCTPSHMPKNDISKERDQENIEKLKKGINVKSKAKHFLSKAHMWNQ
jgi:hypothetical protein